jgi:hypothetical protein
MLEEASPWKSCVERTGAILANSQALCDPDENHSGQTAKVSLWRKAEIQRETPAGVRFSLEPLRAGLPKRSIGEVAADFCDLLRG